MSRRTRRPWLGGTGRRVRCHRTWAAGPRDPLVRPLRLEPLEDRRLLAITVSTLADAVDGDITPGNYSLREALANAAAGETINFSVVGTINLTSLGQLNVTKNLTITGPGVGLLTISAFAGTDAVGDGARVFTVDDGVADVKAVTISGLAMTGGDVGGNGGAILSKENLTLADCKISGNVAKNGGGVFNDGGSLAILSCTVSDNSLDGAFASGGGVYAAARRRSPIAPSAAMSPTRAEQFT